MGASGHSPAMPATDDLAPSWPRRHAAVLTAVLSGAVLTGLAVGYDLQQGRRMAEAQMRWRAEDQAARFQRSLDRSLEAVDALAAFFAASERVEREEFSRYVQGALARHPEIVALQWLPQVRLAERPAFEAQLARWWPGARLSELDAAGGLAPAGRRPLYFPILFVEPLPAYAAVVGLDAAALGDVRTTLEAARDAAAPAVSGPVGAPLADPGPPVVWVSRAVYRRDALEGYAAGLLRIGALLDAALRGHRPTGLDVLILDRSGGATQVLHAHASRSRGAHAARPTLAQMLAGPHHRVTLQVPGRQWEMLFRPAPAFHAEFKNHRWVWILLLGGLLTALLALHLHRRVQALQTVLALNAQLSGLNRELVLQSERMRLARQVIDHVRDAVIVTDAATRVVDVNPAFTHITGYRPEEVLGGTPAVLKSGLHDAAFYAELWGALKRDGHWQGQIWNRRRDGEIYPTWQSISAVRDGAGRVTHYVSVMADVSELERTRAELAHLAQHDPLTDLPNRLLFQDRLEHALERARREQGMLAVLFLDLDRFKDINDSLGHAAGDRLLQEVAGRLRGAVRREDTVARMGGDEFIILMEGLRHEEDAEHLARKLLAALATPMRIDGGAYYVTTSIGISLYPRDGTDGETLVRNADAAMYRAKARGRNAYDFYTEALTQRAMERVQLETELRQALARGQLSVHYQPLVELASGRLVGAEALLRWRHPELGEVSPERFIPIAEETGLICEIGAWVLREACRQAKAWLDAGLPIGTVAVNVAGPQIQRSDFVATVRQTLAETGLAPEHLELEVTEGFVMGQAESAIGVLEGLSRLGVRLAIDDFGTGYSSLAYLKRLPFDKLKVDKSFVRGLPEDEEDAAIAAAVIALGRALGLTVLAEGVETAAQADYLRYLGCHQAQGWYYGRPVPAQALHALAASKALG